MAATIRVGKFEATVEDLVWTSEYPDFTDMLNSMLSPNGPSGADRNPDLTAAQKAVAFLGGEVVRFDPAEYVEGRIY